MSPLKSSRFFKLSRPLLSFIVIAAVCQSFRKPLNGDWGLIPLEYDEAEAENAHQTDEQSCGLADGLGNDISLYELYKKVHKARFPTCAVGKWVNRPDQAVVLSTEHLKCLNTERQGNCHDPTEWTRSPKEKSIQARKDAVLNKLVLNSPGILQGSDPWTWESDLEYYKVLPRDNKDKYQKTVSALLSNRTIFLAGDSLSRQWGQAMRCELIHVLGVPAEVAERRVRYFWIPNGFKTGPPRFTRGVFRSATERDYVVFNFGHHTGWKLGEDWPSKYRQVLEDALGWDFGRIPDEHIFFRTTTVRHFHPGKDWNENSTDVKAGGDMPNMLANWSDYGGKAPEQPEQNFIAFDTLLSSDHNEGKNITHSPHKRINRFRILDTSPMMLARADATFDGSHFCLPGPIDFWSRLLYYRMEHDEKRQRG